MSAIADSISVTGVSEAGDRRRRIVAIIGASSGNLVEWYDFYAYAFTSIYFASAFFPSGDATSQLLATAGIFAVALVRWDQSKDICDGVGARRGRCAANVPSHSGFGPHIQVDAVASCRTPQRRGARAAPLRNETNWEHKGRVPWPSSIDFDCAFSATRFGVASKQPRCVIVTGGHLHLEFQDSPCPASAGLFIPTGQSSSGTTASVSMK
jgi:hypothetical protein